MKDKILKLPNYEVKNQEELDSILSLGEEQLRFSIIELVGRFKIDKIPFNNMRFMRPSNLDIPAPTIELGKIDCPEYVDFIEVRLLGGKLNLSNFIRLFRCSMTNTTINKCTLYGCHISDSRIVVLDQEDEYKVAGGKYMPFINSCYIENCILDKANIYFDFGGYNILNITITTQSLRYQDIPQPSDCKYLIGNNLLLR